MEHLDLAGFITTPTHWTMSTAFDQQDAIYLSSSRQMLEPIIEETSEDEEHAQSSCSGCDHAANSVWSSAESETGSVIRIEMPKDADSISERDFACPAKRARRYDDSGGGCVDDCVLLRRCQRPAEQSNDNAAAIFDGCDGGSLQRHSTGSRRFDDFYSDSDSLSYHSLSRSSSLIQFESLERQLLLQDQHSSLTSLGNSSPSVLSFEGGCLGEEARKSNGDVGSVGSSGGNSGCNSGSNSRRGSQSSLLRRFESADGRLHQTYYDLDKLQLDDGEQAPSLRRLAAAAKLNGPATTESETAAAAIADVKSDSESSSSSSSSSGNSILHAAKPSPEDLTPNSSSGGGGGSNAAARMAAFQRGGGGKNSAENLSEDSGYCEPSTLRRSDSKSIPKSFEKLCEEEECFSGDEDGDEARNTHSKNCALADDDLCEPKIASLDATFVVAADSYDGVKNSYARAASPQSPQQQHHDAASSKQKRSLTHSPSPVSDAGSTSSCASTSSFTWLPTRAASDSQPQQRAASAEFGEQPRNSLPHDGEANGSFGADCYSSAQPSSFAVDQPPNDNAHKRHQTSLRTPFSDSDSASNSSDFGQLGVAATTESAKGRASSDELDASGSRSRRRARTKHSKAATFDSSESQPTSESEDSFFAAGNARTARSCSWTLSGDSAWRHCEPSAAQSLGYLNASYHNLTLLDYSGHESGRRRSRSRANAKRCSAAEMDASRGAGDYESIICKGNFLLDELSAIYDRNASILNDQQLEAPLAAPEAAAATPKAPPRVRRTSNSSHSDAEPSDAGVTVDVQITLRKPSARQKHGRRQDVATSDTASACVKTFDQDPTNLRTNYAQSLEKCNFDVSATSVNALEPSSPSQSRSLPKRRFHSHGNGAAHKQQRSIGSSTPNLNAFNARGDEVEDEMFVSSAHTSMHQLPQGNAAPKPLGILLPIGSRSSFGKEVSFCPVVSKYSWQEQSSEECNEPSKRAEAPEEESDDELLDNADATVIFNTKENEMIATRYTETTAVATSTPKKQQEQQRANEQRRESDDAARETERERRQHMNDEEQLNSKETSVEERKESRNYAAERAVERRQNIATAENVAAEKLVSAEAELGADAENDSAGVVRSALELAFVSHEATDRATAVNAATQQQQLKLRLQRNFTNATAAAPRPLSLHLPILSEPPTNRAHILYASQQLIDNLELQQRKVCDSVTSLRAQSANNLDPRQQQQETFDNKQNRVSEMSFKCSENEVQIGAQAKPLYNNNNEIMKSKFKADEKHPSSKGFLSRFAHGFRFSLRRNKKKQQLQQQQQQQQQQQNFEVCSVKKSAAKQKKQNSPDFIYIPLKGPSTRTADSSANNNHGSRSVVASSSNVAAQPLVTGKPPLPKQPPPQQRHSASGPAPHTNASKFTSISNQFHTTNKPTTATTPATIDECFLACERSYYDADSCRNQSTSGMHANGRLSQTLSMEPNSIAVASAAASSEQFICSPSRASVSQKTQMFNNLSNGKVYAKNASRGGWNAGGGAAAGACKIGLIETNLDTHETVISGKTRSLMELGPQQHQHNHNNNGSNHQHHHQQQQQQHQHQQRFKFIKRVNGGRNDVIAVISGDDDDDVGDYDDVADDEDVEDVVVNAADGTRSVVVVKGVTQAAGQIASVRRPHKSMEFLLDKENQKNILPPENELQKSHEQNPIALSEHQLRVQASLQRLNIPDWFRQYNQTTARSPDGATSYKPGNFTRKRASESSSGRWTGLNSKTTSLSSLGSQRSDRSPLLLSPSAHSHHGGQTSAGSGAFHAAGTGASGGSGAGGGNFSRWSTSHLNSSQTSPSCSQRGSFSRGGPANSSFMSVASGQSNSSAVRGSFRQPYLGWRSQEKLSQPRTPHERLASSLLAAQQQQRSTPKADGSNGSVKQLPVTPEIQSSIKEVTSAIVHYVNDQTQQQRSRSASPNSR